MSDWNPMDRVKPTQGQLCDVIYADGMQCRAKYAGGWIFYPEGSNMYRYVNVTMWKPAT